MYQNGQPILIGGEPSYVPSTDLAMSGRKPNTFGYFRSYDTKGVPYYLEPANDFILQDLLDLIDNSFLARGLCGTHLQSHLSFGQRGG